MPWLNLTMYEERLKFVSLHILDEMSFSDLCRLFNISRTAGYDLIKRYNEYGVDALKDASRAPHTHPNRTDSHIVEEILKFRKKHPDWGARKIKVRYEREHPDIILPAASTIGSILDAGGLIPKIRPTRKSVSSSKLTDSIDANDVWTIDYKGQITLQDKTVCYPLTIVDHSTRMILSCQGQDCISGDGAKSIMISLFRSCGLPKVIRSDNGTPFAGSGQVGLSRLSAWWIRLGMTPERIKPGKPQQNGRHERMHRVLKKATMLSPCANLREQQQLFDRFVHEYNYERPHEALEMSVPGDLYHRSPREYPLVEPKLEYNESLVTRYVRTDGSISWNGDLIYISEVIASSHVGLEQIDEKLFLIFYGHLPIGVLDEEQKHLFKSKDAQVMIESYQRGEML